MSTVDLSTPALPSMSLGDLIAEAVDQPEMADETEAVVTSEPAVTETPTKVKKPRKTPVKKEKPAAKASEDGDTAAGDAEIETPTKSVKKPRKPTVKKEKPAPKEGNEETNGDAEEPTTPKAAAPKKRAPIKKKVDAAPTTPKSGENGDVDMTTPATNGGPKASGKKRGPAKAANGETPTKKSKTANGDTPAKRSAGTKFPECWAEFCDEDKLIVNMRRQGKKWEEIEPAWTEITGTVPGKDSLRKRFAKLEAVAQDFNDADLSKLVAAKKAIDAEFTALKEQMRVEQAAALEKMKNDQANALKKQETAMWSKISEHIKAAGGEEYKAFLIEKKYKALEKSGDIDANGNLAGAVAEDNDDVDEDMENLSVSDDDAATNGNGHVEDAEADAMEE